MYKGAYWKEPYCDKKNILPKMVGNTWKQSALWIPCWIVLYSHIRNKTTCTVVLLGEPGSFGLQLTISRLCQTTAH